MMPYGTLVVKDRAKRKTRLARAQAEAPARPPARVLGSRILAPRCVVAAQYYNTYLLMFADCRARVSRGLGSRDSPLDPGARAVQTIFQVYKGPSLLPYTSLGIEWMKRGVAPIIHQRIFFWGIVWPTSR